MGVTEWALDMDCDACPRVVAASLYDKTVPLPLVLVGGDFVCLSAHQTNT